MSILSVLISVALLLFVLPLALLAAVFAVEVVAAVLHSREEAAPTAASATPHRLAVLVPAHNEGAGLIPTVKDIRAQLGPRDRLLVVADNCDDDTAARAAVAGAQVTERNDPGRRGKGYALDWGIRHLSADPPDIVIIIDADCRLSSGALPRLAAACAATGRPAQALDLMTAGEDSPLNHQIAEFAWRVKNWVRPLGLMALGLPCQLMGTGMAFPWDVISRSPLATGHIVEDLKLGLDLASAGHPPMFCPGACVTSRFPISAEATARQRQRWEHGHLGIVLEEAPSLIWRSVARRDPALLALALDAAVPPLALLGLLLAGLTAATGLAVIVSAVEFPFWIALASLVLWSVSLFLAWFSHGRDVLAARAVLAALPSFLAGRLRSYLQLLTGGRASRWVKTERR